MMREIKFRGKRIDNGEWVYGDLIQLNDGLKFIVDNRFGACIDDKGRFINTEAPFVNVVSANTVGQYTGLNDKNGKEIYEGCIVEKHVDNNYRNGNKIPVYRKYLVAFVLEFGSGELEVVGNIYESEE